MCSWKSVQNRTENIQRSLTAWAQNIGSALWWHRWATFGTPATYVNIHKGLFHQSSVIITDRCLSLKLLLSIYSIGYDNFMNVYWFMFFCQPMCCEWNTKAAFWQLMLNAYAGLCHLSQKACVVSCSLRNAARLKSGADVLWLGWSNKTE